MSPLATLSALGTLMQLRASINGWSHRISLASILGGACLVLGFVALIFLGFMLFLVLSDTMAPVVAAAIVAGLFAVLAVIAGLLARRAITRGRGGTGTHALPATASAIGSDPMATAVNVLSSVDSRTLFALGAGLIGGLLASQLHERVSRPNERASRARVREPAE